MCNDDNTCVNGHVQEAKIGGSIFEISLDLHGEFKTSLDYIVKSHSPPPKKRVLNE